ncbi:ABC transporter permease, partial [Puia sp.]|uniref:ABC transporter permease n=1 Tax=Puia sp. TaxID=2045100 RepID=UPI002F420004
MIKNYLILAWRHLGRSKSSAAINIFGLATGIAITLLIGLWIADELSFDHYAPDHARVAQAMTNAPFDGRLATDDYVCMPMGQTLRDRYSDLFSRTALVCNHGNRIFAYANTQLSAECLYAQYQLAELFGFRILKGAVASASDPSTALISQSLATALFGTTDPIGKNIKVDNHIGLAIGAVYADLPANTSFHGVKAILPWYNNANSYHNSESGWDNSNGHLYVQLAPGVTAGQASARINNLFRSRDPKAKQEAFIYPMDRVRLHGEFTDGKPSGGRIRFVQLFGLIGAFVLLLACINFMNLSTARSERQAKEVGIRKTIGSLRSQIVTQFLAESVLVTFIALAVALLLVEAALPSFNGLAAKDIQIPWTNPWFATILITFTLFTGLVAGSYPAFYLSHFRPVEVLTRRFKAGRYPTIARQVLVVLQFTVSLTLVIGTIVVYAQIQYAKDRPVGYNRDGLITVDMNTPELKNNYDALSADLTGSGWVQGVAASSMDINDFDNNTVPSWRGKRADMPAYFFHPVVVTREFGATIGWTILQGRDFSPQYGTDSSAVILNEAAVALIGIKNIVGEIITFNDHEFHVIGIAKNMISNSPYDRIDPTAFLGSGYHSVITLRLRPGAPAHTALS